MLRNAVDGIIKRVHVVKVNSACSQPVKHPLCILKRHGPAQTVEALDHGKLLSQLACQRADCFRVGTVFADIFIIDPFQRAAQLLMGRVSAHDRAVALRAHAHGGNLCGVLQMVAPAPVRHLLMVALHKQLMDGVIEIIPYGISIFIRGIVKRRQMFQKIVPLHLLKVFRQPFGPRDRA